MMRADRARGLTVHQIADRHGVSVGLAHRVVSDVHIMLPNRWHLARQREAPAPFVFRLHGLLTSKGTPERPPPRVDSAAPASEFMDVRKGVITEGKGGDGKV